ncbi:hemerythrin domain-containing protein [Paucibacter sp. R3-3]|uniref:Hemerythrin domain-containing protein n=1 Tax=Roseateles agri TaxID=3098619 RepID=A0ABU5DRW4_9BURK|nr:hemerythrin domain-containing protein [Paucibacter sp. R3-3]MDY0749060.1 hemerythrin domain-containing protein [Paucibacter sp. R3-3]
MNIDKYKTDHVEIMRLVTDLKQMVLGDVKTQPGAIAQKIVAISSTIKLHLAIEDQVLYPALKRSSSVQVAQTATRFQQEMGPIAADFATFARRWNTEQRVSADVITMRMEAVAILDRIHRRMQQENRELYPLAERL